MLKRVLTRLMSALKGNFQVHVSLGERRLDTPVVLTRHISVERVESRNLGLARARVGLHRLRMDSIPRT